MQQRITAIPEDHAARFDLSIHQISQYKYTEAIDNLMLTQQKDPDFKEGATKEMIITVTNMIAPVDNDLAQDIRHKLSNLLAQ